MDNHSGIQFVVLYQTGSKQCRHVVEFNPLTGTKRTDKTSNYWSASSYANNSSNAWAVNFNNGNVNANNKTNTNYVRCVR